MALATATVCLAWSGFLALHSNATYTQTVSNLGLMASRPRGRPAGTAAQPPRGRAARPGRGACSASACLSWGCGQAAWTWYESVLGREVPFPSIADIGYLLFVPLAAAALLAFPSVPEAPVEPDPHRARRAADRQRPAVHELDGRRSARCSRPAVTRLTLTIGLAYPLGDVVIITILLFASSHRSQRASSSRASRPLLFAGLLAFAVADSGFVYLTNSGSYSSGSLIDIGWFCAFAAIFLAGTVRAVDRGGTTEHGRRRARSVRGARAVRAGCARRPPRRDSVGASATGSGASSDGTCWRC